MYFFDVSMMSEENCAGRRLPSPHSKVPVVVSFRSIMRKLAPPGDKEKFHANYLVVYCLSVQLFQESTCHIVSAWSGFVEVS